VQPKFYEEVIKRLIALVHCVRSDFQKSGPWYFLHDKEQAHSSGLVSQFLAK
jgi:hypothetical protein